MGVDRSAEITVNFSNPSALAEEVSRTATGPGGKAGAGSRGGVQGGSQEAALEALSRLSLPTTSEEIWRYTDVSFLAEGEYRLPVDLLGNGVGPSVGPIEVKQIASLGEEGRGEIDAWAKASGIDGASSEVLADLAPLAGLVRLERGVVKAAVLSEEAARAGLEVRAEGAVSAGSQGRSWTLCPLDQDVFTALTAAAAIDVVLRVPAGALLERPVVFMVEAQPSEGNRPEVVPIHFVVEVEEEASLSVVFFHAGGDNSSGARTVMLPVTEVFVGRGARLCYVTIQDYASSCVHIETTRMRLDAGAQVSSAAVVLGATLSRHRFECLLAGEGAESEMLGVYFGNEEQHIDFRTLQDHQAPRTVSDLLYKGAVEDNATAVYAGLVRVEKDAQKINGFQTNKNLVLSEGASAESIPTLEILANDVRCSHASSIGPVDEDEVYYLETRGIDPETAEQLVVEGFFEEVIERIPAGFMSDRIRAEVREKFEARKSTAASAPSGQ
jgi:Fe-S cluster assembly protein SufD